MVHLHCHSMYSLRDSIVRPNELAQRLIELGQDTVAITDHGSSLGGISIYKELKANNIKYIHACEFYICDDLSVKDTNSRYYHLIALCKNDNARLNLNRLISLSELPENKYYRPRINFELLDKYGDDFIITSACLAGEISKALQENNYDKARQIAQKYKDRFGENYFLEIQSRNDSVQISINKQIVKLAQELKIGIVVTTDVHYIREFDKKYQNKYAFNGKYKENGEAYADCYLQSEDEVRANLTYLEDRIVDEAINNTHTIANMCNLNMPLSAPIMPKIDTPKEYGSNKDWLVDICKQGFISKLNIDLENRTVYDESKKLKIYSYDELGVITGVVERNLSREEIQEYVDRFEYEIDSLDRMDFIDYILLVYSYSNVAKRKGIARGSGGGSLVCYTASITNIDPIEHKLYFERFIDVGALDLLESGEITKETLKIPDIDLDFSGDSCKDVLMFLYNKYGEENVASIGKFGTNKTKGTIRDMCRVLDIDLATADKIAKSFENFEIDDIDDIISGVVKQNEHSKQAVTYVKKYPELFEYVRVLYGLPKSFGLHACGKVISTKETDYFLPSCYDSDGVRYLQGDMHDVEDVGLVKIDVLGLRTLDQEYDTLEMSGEKEDFIDPKIQNYSDPKVLDIFRNGDTVGIFQMSSFGMQSTLKKMDVSGIEKLSIANALYRPGAMAYISNFCNRRNGSEEVEYLHDDLIPILKNTYGIIVFQEQLIEIGRLAKLRNPDLLRKATGKKDIKLLNKIQPELKEKLLARNWTESQFERLWSDMLAFAKYSFNKAHSSAYGIIAYMTAKQKAYYPKEFFAGLLNSYIGQGNFIKEKVSEIVGNMQGHKISFNPFNFRNNHIRCSVCGNKILYAIPLIRDCSIRTAEELYEIGKNKYSCFIDLLYELQTTSIDSRQLDILIKLNFFSEFGNTRELCRINDIFIFFKKGKSKSIKKEKITDNIMLEIISKYATDKNKKGEELKSYTILDCKPILTEYESYIKSLNLPDFDYKYKIHQQKELLGYISPTGKEEDRPILHVKKIYPAVRKKDGFQFGNTVITQSIGSGIQSRFTIFNKDYDRCGDILEGELINCLTYERKGEYFNILDYEVII